MRPLPLLILASALATAQVALDCEHPEKLPAGCQAIGKPVARKGHEGAGFLFQKLAHVRVPTASWLKADEGTIEFMVQPSWPVGDTGRHSFVHLGDGNTHITVFRHGGSHVRFVYKGDPAAYRSASVRTGPWAKDTWHRVVASWHTTVHNGLVLYLSVDGRRAFASHARPLPKVPQWTLVGSRGQAESADAVLDNVVLSPTFILPFAKEPVARQIQATIDTRAKGEPMPRTFSFVTPWNSATNPIPFDQAHPYFRRFQEAGFDLVRLVAFSESWLWGTRVTRGDDGKIKLDFSDFDTLLDLYRAGGAEPYIRLAYHTPKVMASKANGKGHNYSTPTDPAEWDDLMRRIVTHCNVDRKLGIRYWVTMLNEADISIRRGQTTWPPILDLYERTTRIVKAIDPTAKVGGPATCGPLPGSQEEDIRTFLRFCKKRELPPDFLCFHAYKRPQPRDFEDAILAVRRVVAEEWPGLNPEYFLDEWNLWVNDSRQNNEYAAAYLAAAVHYQMRAGLTRSSIVSFNSHRSAEEMANRGVTRQGPFQKGDLPIPSARFYAAKLDLDGKQRPVLYTHSVPGKGPRKPYVFGRYAVTIPANGCALRTATAQGIAYDKGDGTQMQVIVHSKGREQHVLRADARKPRWQEHQVDLSLFAGQAVEIEFRTDCGASGNVTADHGVWGSPRLVAGDQTVFDFCAEVGKAETGYVLIASDWHEQNPSLPLIKDNVLTPAYFAYVLLNQLRGQRLPVSLAGRDGIHESDTVGAIACRDGKAIRVLLWHFDPERADYAHILGTPGAMVERQVNLELLVPNGSSWRLKRQLIDATHSNAYTDYVRLGKDTQGGAYNLMTGTVDTVETFQLTAPNGRLRLSVTLRDLSVSLLELQED